MRTRLVTLLLTVAALVAAAPSDAGAFCGFYVSGADGEMFNDATQVVLMRQGMTTVLSMQNHYAGPPEDFAMVVPVPVVLQEEHVKTLPHSVFDKVDQMASPRLVEYWEQDPCYEEPDYYDDMMPMAGGAPTTVEESAAYEPEDLGVTIEAEFKVGEYDVVILSARDSMGLDTWLRQEDYNIPAGAEAVLGPYIESGLYFFVARVDLDEVARDAEGRAILSPLRFHYEADTFSLPVRLGLLNSDGRQDLIIHILAQGQRYEVANYPNVTIPTNIEVHDATKERFAEFYVALFDATLAPDSRAVVTEYAWDAGSCDPCPGPTIDGNDIMLLGGDVVGADGPWGFVLTRLHARYSAEELTDDLVFQAAPPIVGGREVHAGGGLEHGAQPSGMNNFQGRYIIRHPWEGEIACSDPVRGRWGGPPSGASAPPVAARDTAFAPRGGLELAEYAASDIDELGVEAAVPLSAILEGTGAGPVSSRLTPTNPQPMNALACGHCSLRRGDIALPAGALALLLATFGLLVWRRREP